MTTRKRYLTDLTDKQWEQLKALLAQKQTPLEKTREYINGILYILRTGRSWRMMPHDLPNWSTVKTYFHKLRQDGTWERINDALREKVRQASGREHGLSDCVPGAGTGYSAGSAVRPLLGTAYCLFGRRAVKCHGAAQALADFAEQNTSHAWRLMFFHYPLQLPDDRDYLRVWKADRWGGTQPKRAAGAMVARIRRIAAQGSATPLDRVEAEHLFMLELRYKFHCEASGQNWQQGDWWERDYAFCQRRLHPLKWVARLNACTHIYDGEQIGDTAATQAATLELETAGTLFGGNVNQ